MKKHRLKKYFIFVLQKGFSLIELLVVVAIIGILAGIGIIGYDSYVEYTRRLANEANAKLLAAAFIAERTIQIGKLPGRVCTSNITRYNEEPFLACLNTLVQVNKITNPYTGNIYNMANLTWFPDSVNMTLDYNEMPYTPIANGTYIEDGYMVSGGECSDVGGIVATYPSSVNKPFIATCKFFPDPYYQTRGYKFFSLVE
jgi:prepilin-type N-terminal cleavage/methylation domain-containing protein